MTQNNLYMEDDEMRLYVDVQPLLLDEIENSRNAAVASAALAAQSEENARNWKNSIIDYKTSMELFYAQASDGLTNLYNNSRSELTLSKNNVLNSIEMAKRTAINNINTNGQNYVSQVQNIVDNRVSTEHLNQSKCLMTGEETTDLDAVNEVKGYAHSTFDRSKFTVNGSPTITNDGIASGFTSSNYIYKSVAIDKDSEIIIRGSADLVYSSDNKVIFLASDASDNTQLGIRYYSSQIQILARKSADSFAIATYNYNGNGHLDYELVFKNGEKIGCALKIDGVSVNVTIPEDLTGLTSNITTLWFGSAQNGSGAFGAGSVDLKCKSVKVNGVPVFSGNKTGLDTIKPDDYTIYPQAPSVSTVTVTADGIASGFTDNNYIEIPFDIENKPWELEFDYKPTAIPSGTAALLARKTGSSVAGLVLNLNLFNNSIFPVTAFSTDGTTFDISMQNPTIPSLEIGAFNNIKIGWDGACYYQIINNTAPVKVENSAPVYDSETPLVFGVGRSLVSHVANGEIDMNSVKLTVNGNLTVQGCLKIPYTESKTGSKIVDSIYCKRVKDVYEQGFLQRYYALDEANNRAWLPIGDVYGMIESLRKLILQLTSG